MAGNVIWTPFIMFQRLMNEILANSFLLVSMIFKYIVRHGSSTYLHRAENEEAKDLGEFDDVFIFYGIKSIVGVHCISRWIIH